MRLCDFEVGGDAPLFLIAGPCVIESEALVLETAATLKELTARLGVPFVFKSSFDKANRSSHTSYRGPGLAAGLRILERVRSELGVPVLTDVHEDTPLDEVAAVADVLQTPAFLCRQTNFIQNVARQGRPVNIKKAQFLAPWDMQNVVDKARATGNQQIMVCERGTSFGYNYLVSDMRALVIMRATGCPVVFDATHSVQLPGGQGTSSGGQREFVPLARRRWRSAWRDCSWRPTPIRERAQRRPEFLATGRHAGIASRRCATSIVSPSAPRPERAAPPSPPPARCKTHDSDQQYSGARDHRLARQSHRPRGSADPQRRGRCGGRAVGSLHRRARGTRTA